MHAGRRLDDGLGLTELPLRNGRRPVATHASASHRVGLVSIPALGAVRRAEKLRQVAADVVEGLLADDRGDELSADAQGHGTVRFTSLAVLANLRLLAGMIRANRPARVMARLSRSAAAALGTGAYAVSSASMWSVAHESSWLRLLGIGVVSIVLILVAMVVAHGLWERARDPAARERVVLFNIVTVITLAIGVVTLYLALFILMALAAGVMIPPESLQRETGKPPGVLDYAQVAWLAASVATVGGALGSLIESDEAVRDATYRPAPHRS